VGGRGWRLGATGKTRSQCLDTASPVDNQKMLDAKRGDESHLSSAPWNDGGLSFFTKEHLAVQTEGGESGGFSRKRRIFRNFWVTF